MDAFCWVAHLDTGDAWAEFDADGCARGWASIPPGCRVVAVELIAQRATHHDVRIAIPDGAEAVFFRRRRLTVRGSDGAIQPHGSTTVVGWKAETDGRYWGIDANGNTRVTSDLGALQ